MSLKRREETSSESSTADEAEYESSFELTDCIYTDITFTFSEEEKELRFYKSLLSRTSPVFDRMLNSDFEDETASVIDLPNHAYDDMVLLFEQMHPAFASRPIKDYSLEVLMKLAQQYQVRHLMTKCGQYVANQTRLMELEESRSEDDTVTRSSVDPDQTAEKARLYLTILREYPELLSDEYRDRLEELADNRSVRQLEWKKPNKYTSDDVVKEVESDRYSILVELLTRRPAIEQQRGLPNDALCASPTDQSRGG